MSRYGRPKCRPTLEVLEGRLCLSATELFPAAAPPALPAAERVSNLTYSGESGLDGTNNHGTHVAGTIGAVGNNGAAGTAATGAALHLKAPTADALDSLIGNTGGDTMGLPSINTIVTPLVRTANPVSADWYFLVSSGSPNSGIARGGLFRAAEQSDPFFDTEAEGGDRVDAAAGLDILIANTGGDRATGDDVIGGWGSDWISGGTGQDAVDPSLSPEVIYVPVRRPTPSTGDSDATTPSATEAVTTVAEEGETDGTIAVGGYIRIKKLHSGG